MPLAGGTQFRITVTTIRRVIITIDSGTTVYCYGADFPGQVISTAKCENWRNEEGTWEAGWGVFCKGNLRWTDMGSWPQLSLAQGIHLSQVCHSPARLHTCSVGL